MADRHDMLRHERVAQHASVRGEKSQVSEALIPSGHADAYISGAHASLYASSFTYSRKKRVSPTDTSIPPSSRMRHISPIQVPNVLESPVVPEAHPTADASEPVPPPADEAVEPVPPLADETVEYAEPKVFRGGPIALSLLYMYPDHVARDIWDGEVELVRFIHFNLCLF